MVSSLPCLSCSMLKEILQEGPDPEKARNQAVTSNSHRSSSDVTPTELPRKDFFESEIDTSLPRCSYSLPSNADVRSPSTISKASTQLSSGQVSYACSSNDKTLVSRKSHNRQRRRDKWEDIKRKCLKNLEPAFGKTKSGNPVLFLGEHRFNRVTACKGPSIRWTCVKKPKGCRVTVRTVDNVIIVQHNIHNH
ncbi:unnamed protein product [Chilo suppressalis]|uniref:FLYWCH-type domain-containing protein n=1 Tax=Chilo suppressalis TaxID=168631 RepID=A0ABN8AT88_CHISP|nr:unnamed protein product [Chilo suppressalis]